MRRLALLAAGLLGLVGLALAGGGASASPGGAHGWHRHGGLGVVLAALGATGNGTPAITLAPLGPVGSSFSTGLTTVTVTNTGHTTVSDVTVRLGDPSSSAALRAATWSCLIFDGRVLANERLTTVEGYGAAALPKLALRARGTATYAVVYYAGTSENTGCGGPMTAIHLRRHDGDGASAWYGRGSAYPAGTTNPASASLPNATQRGALDLSVTTTYEDHHRCSERGDARTSRGAHDCD